MNVSIAIGKLPKPEQIRMAVKNLDNKTLSDEQIGNLIRIWPPPEEVATLMEENAHLAEGEKWDKAEDFLLELLNVQDGSAKMLKQKLQIWDISLKFPEKRVVIQNYLKNFEQSYSTLMDCKILQKVLGYTLALGNIMNGGTNKGRADGFYLDAISKTTTLKAADG